MLLKPLFAMCHSPLMKGKSYLSHTDSAWKSGPVRSFVHIWQDRDRDQSPAVERPRETGLNRHEPVQSGLIRFFTVDGPVWTSLRKYNGYIIYFYYKIYVTTIK